MLNRPRLAILLLSLACCPACAAGLPGGRTGPQADASVRPDADDVAALDAGSPPHTIDGGHTTVTDAGPDDAGLGPLDAGRGDAGPADPGSRDAGPRDAGPDPDVCPPGRFGSGTVHYHYDVDPRERELLDLTIAAPFFRYDADQPTIPFPWALQSHPQVVSMPESQYIAMRFEVPADIPAGWRGSIAQNETAPGPLIELAISRFCGDFSPSDDCHHVPRSLGGLGLGWNIAGDSSVACPLVPGETYYLNIRFKHPLSNTESPYYCNASGTRCKFTVAQYSWAP